MAYRTLKWEEARTDAAGGLDVPIYPPPDSAWLDAFQSAHDARQDEVRGQVYEDVEVRGSTLVLQGVTDDSLVQTRDFFNMVVQKANREAVRIGAMMELRRMSTTPEHPQELSDHMVAWALSNSLSRQDMAVATGLPLKEVNRIIRETAEHDRDIKVRALRERVARHMPPALSSTQ